MKSIVITRPGSLLFADEKIPAPAAHEVRVKVKYAGVCGSDVHIYRGHNPFASYPRVIGHEFFGIVDAVGESVDTARIGQRVVIDPVISCGCCYPCRMGRPNVCLKLKVLGVHRDGGFSEYVCVPAANIHEVPSSIPDRHAALIEPFSVAANMTAQLQPATNDSALIYGAGPMGLALVQVLKNVYQVGMVMVVDRIPSRLEMAIECGADVIINNLQPSEADYLQGIRCQPTLIIDAACHPAILSQAITLASPAGRIGIMGFSDAETVIRQKDITSKELSIFSSRLNSVRFPQVIEWMAAGKLFPHILISHDMEMEQVEQALALFESNPDSCCKILLRFPD